MKFITTLKNVTKTFIIFLNLLLYSMNQEQKAQRYQYLLFEFDKLSNQIASIKGESLELNESQNSKINQLQMRQGILVNEMKTLF